MPAAPRRLARAAAQQFRTLRHRLAQPRLHAGRVPFADQRPHLRALGQWIAGYQLLNLRAQCIQQIRMRPRVAITRWLEMHT